MKVIPAIDIKNGKCVRLKKGNFSDITIYSESPLEQARLFKDNGFDFTQYDNGNGAIDVVILIVAGMGGQSDNHF